MKPYQITITGSTPLLMHHDNIQWADAMDAWSKVPDNKKLCKPGDDRTPAWRWLGNLYHDGKRIVIPQENIMRAIMEGGAMVPVPGGRNGKTFKAQTQSGIICATPTLPLLVNGKELPMERLAALEGETDFAVHSATAAALGFGLLVKRAKIGQAKHVRVRPVFAQWAATGQFIVTDEQITADILCSILDCAGRYKGLGDWRPGSKTPGVYGMFKADVKPI